MKIIVTGGAGFIGSALCRYLVADAHCQVLNVDKLTYAGNLKSLSPIDKDPRYAFIKADVCDFDALTAVIRDFQPDNVVHLAAETHVDRSIMDAGTFVRTNAVGTYTLLEAVRIYWRELAPSRRHAFRFLHVSTDEVYGSLGPAGVSDETSPYNPSSPYSASKAAGDHLVTAWYRTYRFPALTAICCNNYGPYQFPEKLIPLAILNAREGKPIPVYGDGSHVRDWLYVEDCASALYRLSLQGRVGERYNVGARSECSNISLIRCLCSILDDLVPGRQPHEKLITFVPDRPGHDARYAVDSRKVEAETSWRARETLISGLTKTVKWYMTNEDWWQSLRRIYAGERLGLLEPADGHGYST